MKFEIYRTIIIFGKTYDSLLCVAFTEEAAKDIVESMRKTLGNQTVFYKEIK